MWVWTGSSAGRGGCAEGAKRPQRGAPRRACAPEARLEPVRKVLTALRASCWMFTVMPMVVRYPPSFGKARLSPTEGVKVNAHFA